jgi:chemotaxis protein MotA
VENTMLVIIGILVVFGSILGGFLMEKGNLLVLLQPAELLIIGGAGFGTLLVANPPSVLKRIGLGIIAVIKGDPYTRAFYLEILAFLYEFYGHLSRVGVGGIENVVDNPEKSPIFAKYPHLLADRPALDFLCDTLRTYSTGGISHYQLEHLMECDLEIMASEDRTSSSALTMVADSLPGLGIVAAVLGVVITMSALGGPPEEIGEKVAAALLGTFLGILLCYGAVGPLAAYLSKLSDNRAQYLLSLRNSAVSYLSGIPPMLAVEFARRSIPTEVRPSFKEVEQVCRSTKRKEAAA